MENMSLGTFAGLMAEATKRGHGPDRKAQIEFEAELDARRRRQRNVRLVLLYGRFLRTKCSDEYLRRKVNGASKRGQRNAVIYQGNDIVKYNLTAEWLREVTPELDLELTLNLDSILVSW
jgi:hypothetical protein